MHVIVTGGSSGIGFSVASLYAGRGVQVSLIARDAARLEAAAQRLRAQFPASKIATASADTAVGEEVAAAIEVCEGENGPCDILIASAGMVEPAPFHEQSAILFDRQITVNLLGTVNTVRTVYDGMRARRRGTIVIISSGAALIGIYGYAAYCASKSALTGFVEALTAEAVSFGVNLCLAFPPDTQTPQYERELPMRPPEAAILMGKVKPWPVEAVARRIVKAVDKRRSRVYFDLTLWGLYTFGAFAKPVLMWSFLRHLARTRDGQGSSR
ncbi:SDR family oxidoreductase [Oryzifoliimicrobium ureilyticus]|uniref:SDR family oxidoreductase n=1 Tax=Oryzifoliimicrobium ureilyticus TaxID=3113724 RepID=UPI0030766033